MNNKEYWQKRFVQLEDLLLRQGEVSASEIEKIYLEAAQRIEQDISSFYKRFADISNITYSEAKKLLKSNELEEFKWTIEEYIKYAEENSLNSVWIKQLNNASMKSRVNRLQALEYQIQNSLEKVYASQIASTQNTAKKVYEEGYYNSIYEIQKGFNTGFAFNRFNENEVNKMINRPWTVDGVNFSERIWNNKDKLINTIHTELTQSLIRGEAPEKTIRTIVNKLNVSKKNARRLVMTESCYFATESRKDCFNDLNVEKYEILTTLDTHTCQTCIDMERNGPYNMKDYQSGITAPPFHPHDRCCTIPYFDDKFTLDEERAARSIKGKTYYIPGNIKYEEWEKKYIK